MTYDINDFISWKPGDSSLEGKDILTWSKANGYQFINAKEAKSLYFQGVLPASNKMKVIGVKK